MSENISEVLNKSSNVNVNNKVLNNVNVKINKSRANLPEVRAIAQKLVASLQDEASFKFFCKVAWNIPENIIWTNLEQALTGKNPRAYFTFLCNLTLEDN